MKDFFYIMAGVLILSYIVSMDRPGTRNNDSLKKAALTIDLEKVVNRLNENLPVKNHEGIVMHKVKAQGKTITYSYTYPISEIYNNQNAISFKRELKGFNTRHYCHSPDTKIFRENMVIYRTVYYDLKGNILANVTITNNDC